MAEIDRNTVRHLSKLSKIGCSQQEEEQFVVELKQIVQYIEQLNTLDTSDVEPLSYVIEGQIATPRRDDIVESTITTKEFLQMAPDEVAQLLKVPKVQNNV